MNDVLNTFEGVACVDMLMRDLISDLIAFPNLNVGYTLMLDSAGNVVLSFLTTLSYVGIGQIGISYLCADIQEPSCEVRNGKGRNLNAVLQIIKVFFVLHFIPVAFAYLPNYLTPKF